MGVTEIILIAIVILPAVIIVTDNGNMERKKE